MTFNHEDNLELISAYVDGEVSPDEQVRAEELLATDERCKMHHDSLLGMRSGLQKIPAAKLNASLEDLILSQVADLEPGRAVDSVSAATDIASPDLQTQPSSPASSSQTGNGKSTTTIVAAVIALAAAILLLVYSGILGQNEDVGDLVQPNVKIGDPDKDPGRDPDGSDHSDDLNKSNDTHQNSDPNAIEGHVQNSIAVDDGNSDANRIQFALMLELVLDAQAAEQDLFEQKLAQHGIAFSKVIPVDSEVRSGLLETRLLKDRRNVAVGEGNALEDQNLAMVLVETDCGTYDALARDLVSLHPISVLDYQYDMALFEDDYAVFQLLREVPGTADLADATQSQSPVTDIARRLVLDQLLKQELVKKLGALPLIAIQTGGEFIPQPEEQEAPALPPQLAAQERMKKLPCVALFVIRWQDPAE